MRKMVCALLAALLLTAVLGGCGNEAYRKNIINEKLAGTESFSFGTGEPGAGVDVSGTVYVQNRQKEQVATVSARVESGAEAPEGVSLYVAKGWVVTKVLSDYPQGSDAETVYNNAVIVKTADSQSEWAYIVELGCNRSAAPENGGTGNVIVELRWDYGSVKAKEFKMLAAVGAGYAGGTPVNGTTSILLQLPM